MATTKLVLGISLALLAAVGAGWVWGTSGRWDSDRALQIAELRAELLEGRAAVLVARLDIYSVNSGEAARHFEAARTSLRAANARLLSLSLTEDAKSLEAALTLIDEAQRLAGLASSIRMRTLWPATRRRPSAMCSGAWRNADARCHRAYRESHYVWQKDRAQ